MNYKLNGEEYIVKIVRKKNKNTYVRVQPNHEILVTTGPFTTNGQIKKLIVENIKKLEQMALQCQQDVEEEDKIYFLGKMYDIIIVSEYKKVVCTDGIIYADSKEKVKRWYKKQTLLYFQKRVKDWYSVFEEPIPNPKVKVRTMKTRWGVCNKRDNSITLNLKLMQYSEEKLDYVIVHELSHFVHFDHSPSFWKVVYKYCPQYKTIRKELKR